MFGAPDTGLITHSVSINQGLTEDFGSVYTVKNVPSTKPLNNYLNPTNPCGLIRKKQVQDKDFACQSH